MIYEIDYTVQQNQLDTFGRVRPSALLGFALSAAGGHCARLGVDWNTMAEKGLFWAVLRHRLQIVRYPEVGERLTVKTWPMPTTRSAYPRAAVALDSAGREVFRLTSLWVLMDMAQRSMVLPGKSGVGVEGVLMGDELPAPGSIAPCQLTQTVMRTVCPEDLDKNNHMTNTRYLDWIDDLQDTDFRRTHAPREIHICYLAEALPGENITLGTTLSPDGFLQAEGYVTRTDAPGEKTRIFGARIYF